MAAMARQRPRAGSHNHLREGQPAQREGHQPVQNHRLEEVIGADIAGLGRQDQSDCDQSDVRPASGQIARASRSTPQTRRDEGQNEDEEEPGRTARAAASPGRGRRASRDAG